MILDPKGFSCDDFIPSLTYSNGIPQDILVLHSMKNWYQQLIWQLIHDWFWNLEIAMKLWYSPSFVLLIAFDEIMSKVTFAFKDNTWIQGDGLQAVI